jgi:hypothetical protein
MGASNNYKPLQTGFSRVFLIEGRARPDHRPEYFSSLKMSGVSQSFGDVTRIEIPDPNEYGKFLEVDRIRGSMERATFSLAGRYAAAIKSRMLELARNKCPVDIQLHIGECTDPSAFNTFSKSIIAEDCLITTHSTDELGALESGESAQINEMADISSRDYYEILPMSFTPRAGDLVTNQISDVAFSDTASCGSCSSESDGCQKVFAVSKGAGGSPGTPPDILFSGDSGLTWKAEDVDTLTDAQDADGVAGVGEYIVVISNLAVSLSYALKQDFIDEIDPVFVEVTTGFVASGKPKAIVSAGRKAFIVGESGYVYYTEDPTSGVNVLDAGVATDRTLLDVDLYDENNIVAVGNDGVVIYTTDQDSWDVTSAKPVGVGIHLTGVEVKSKTEWWVTASNGEMFYTLNSGKSWHEKTLPGTVPTKMNGISFATDSVGFATGIVSGRARIYRTFDGGYSWVTMPEGGGAMTPANEFIALAVCKNNPNIVLAGGLNTNGTDGILVVGR